MLIQGSYLESAEISSIRSGSRIGRINKLVINPHNLHIDALKGKVISLQGEQLVLPDDIRAIGPNGIVIDDHERLIEPDDAIRLQPILKIDFSMHNLVAYSGQRRIGVVEGFAVDRESLFIQKIHVRPNLLSRMSKSQLVFDRSQVEEVTKKKIVFSDANVKQPAAEALNALKNSVQASLSASTTEE